ncbi:MAG TPA: SDR family oxidoreductase [Tepidiformaceae bacterium]|nr:SDR family oxidoreductase [Tepidiformaceae bacterium]
MGRLDGKVAVITGGASGVGEASARLFVREGARVVIGDMQREKGEAVAASIGPECRFVATDVSSSEDVAGMVGAAVQQWGRLDVMYNNAGIGGGEGSIVDCTEETWDRTIAVDLKGVWLGMKHCIPQMLANGGGSIISTASIAAVLGFPGLAAYGAAKAGVTELTRTCAIEYAAQGIRANAILPGGILTPIIYNNPSLMAPMDPEVVRPGMARMQPIPRAGLPEDIANTALWLASDESSFVTGQCIVVDGGYTVTSARGGGRRE